MIIQLPSKHSDTVYISGPMSSVVDHNKPAFDMASSIWRGAGWLVANPHDFGLSHSLSWEEYLKADLRVLLYCTHIAMLPGWEDSRGARAEHALAVVLGMPVYDAFTGRTMDDPACILPLPKGGLPKKSLIEIATELVHTDRQRNYDHPLDNFTRIAQIWSVVLDKEITPEQVGLCMIGLKLARESFSHTEDNLIDTVGYVLCIDMVRKERERREYFAPDPELEDLPF